MKFKLDAEALTQELLIYSGVMIPFTFTFHNYFRVSDIGNVIVRNLNERIYFDQNDNNQTKEFIGEIIDGPINARFYGLRGSILMEDAGENRRVTLTHDCPDLVVWQPGQVHTLKDLPQGPLAQKFLGLQPSYLSRPGANMTTTPYQRISQRIEVSRLE